MRRIVATLLVVASPAVLAAPVGASEGRAARPTAGRAVPAVNGVAPDIVLPPAPGVTIAPPAMPTRLAPAMTPPKAIPAVRALPAKARNRARAVNDAAYSARLQAELCRARAVFCGLDSSGRYPAG